MQAVREGYRDCIPVEEIAAELPGRTLHAVHNLAKRQGWLWGVASRPTRVEIPPAANRTIEEIFRDQAERFRQKRAHHDTKRQGIGIELEDEGPYAVMFFGDPHADDDGCDLGYLGHCLELVRQNPHVFAANIGDLTNNWVGKLAGLYAHQHTTDDEGVALIEWLLESVPWLFVVLGNHDKWSPVAELLCRQHNVPYVSHGAKFRIRRGADELVIDARHDHPGRSMYNPSHGQVKRNYRGSDADIIVGGHIHQSAYTLVRNGETGKLGHCIRVSSFKVVDEYADKLGLPDEAISPAVLAVIDPGAGDLGRVTVFQDPEQGLRLLSALRGREGAKKAA
jgi:hypothetical protein